MSYDRIIQLSTDIGNSVIDLFEEGVVCLRMHDSLFPDINKTKKVCQKLLGLKMSGFVHIEYNHSVYAITVAALAFGDFPQEVHG